MPVELFLSDALHHANAMLTKRLAQRRDSQSSRHIVIVPDRFTLNTERNILEDLNLSGAFDITVTSFRRLAMQLLGKKAGECMSAEGSVMLLSKVILDKKDELRYFVNAHKKAGFAQEIYAVLTLIRNSGIKVDTLKKASSSLPELARKKCEDIALLYDGYLNELALGKTDGSSLLEKFTEQIPENDIITKADVYLTDYFSFTKAQREVICALMKSAKSVNIAMVKGSGQNARIYPEKEIARLCAIAKSAGQKVIENYEQAPLSVARKKVANELFAYGQKQKISGGNGINIYEAESIKEEITHLARRIKLLVKQGYRYKDISVLAGDVEGYLPTIKKVFGQEEIPFFANEQKVLSATPIADFVLQALMMQVDGIERDRVLSLLKNPYLTVSEADVSDFESYTLRYNVNYSRLTGDYPLGKSDKEYGGATRARECFCGLVLSLPKKAKIEEYAKIVVDFATLQKLEEKSEELAREQEEKDDLLSASTTRQSYAKLIKTVEQLSRFAGNGEIDDEGFISMLNNAFSSVKISFIPVFSDSVYVGGAVESRFSDGKVFFIIGAKEGVLPSIKRGEGILGDGDVELLAKCDVELSPTSFDMGLEEKLHVLQLLLMPKEKLYISYVRSPSSSSELGDELTALFDDVVVDNAQTLMEKEEYISLLLSSKSGAKKALLTENLQSENRAILSALVGEKGKTATKEVQKIESGDKLFFPKGATSVTRIESFFRCPYRNFIENGIGARKMETAQSTSYVGTFMHRVFEVGLKVLTEQNFPSGEQFDKTVFDVLEKVFGEEQFGALSTEKYSSLKKRLSKEGYRSLKKTCQRCKRSNYLPTGFEVRFGGGDNQFKLVGKNVALSLHGVVDRIDQKEDKVLLLDYKTGKAPASVKDVYYGTGVQLYVYMSAIEKTQSKNAVGALYYPLVGGYEKEDQKADRLCGFILREEMSEYDREFDGTKESDLFQYGVKGAKPDADGQKISCSQDELDAIKKYSLTVCEKAIDEMSSGYIEPTPLDKACDYCDFAIVCKTKQVKKRKTVSVKKEVITGEKDG